MYDIRTDMPMISTIQWTWGDEDQAKMNMPVGNKAAAAHEAYRRASGPRFEKYVLQKTTN